MKKKMTKIILDLCGGTGSWSKPYKDAGYKVFNLTLPEFDITLWGVHKGFLYFPSMKTSLNDLRINIKDVYGILAAPPCTMFSVARSNAKIPRDLAQGMLLVKKCLEVIWQVQTNHKMKFWAMENPQGLLRWFLGKPALHFNPYEYGDPYKKRTDIWGNFNEPKKKPVKRDSSRDTAHGEDWHHNGINRPKGMDRATFRAITPAGFAKAFFEANK